MIEYSKKEEYQGKAREWGLNGGGRERQEMAKKKKKTEGEQANVYV